MPDKRARWPASTGLSLFGAGFFILGLYLLLNMPRAAGAVFGGEPVFNLQQGFLGMTFSLVGAIFLAAGLRPLSGGDGGD